MTVKPRTIDNLGVESSIRYAKDQEALDTRLIQDSRFIPQKTEVSVLKPYVPSELEQYFAPGKITIWASFSPPPDYLLQGKPLFSYQLIPSLGSYEKQEADSDKLESLESALENRFRANRKKGKIRKRRKRKKRGKGRFCSHCSNASGLWTRR